MRKKLITPESNEPEWIIEQTKVRKRREMLRQREEMETRLAKVRAKEKAQKESYLRGTHLSKKRRTGGEYRSEDNEDEQFVLDDYESDNETHDRKKTGDNAVYSTTTLKLMEQMGMGNISQDEEIVEEDETKVSRRCGRR